MKKLSYQEYGHLKLPAGPHLDLIKDINTLSISATEVPKAACEMPIIFIKDGDFGGFRCVAALGLELKENLFIMNDHWIANFYPDGLATYPIGYGPVINDEGKKVNDLVIDENFDRLSETDGIDLYESDGKESKLLSNARDLFNKVIKAQQASKVFIEFLVEHELLEEKEFKLEILGQPINLSGLFIVNEEKLNALDAETFTSMRDRGYLQVIYSHLASLSQFDQLIRMKIEKARLQEMQANQ